VKEMPELLPGEVFIYKGKHYLLTGSSWSSNIIDDSEDHFHMSFETVQSYTKGHEERQRLAKEKRALQAARRAARRRFKNWFLKLFTRGN
jgi:hypothetical protein